MAKTNSFIILFSVICYLTTFVIEDLGLQVFGNIVRSLDINMMHTVRKSVLLKLQKKCKETSVLWCKVFVYSS